MSLGWLIDTNVVSEWIKPRPDTAVVSWLDEADEERIFLSVVSPAEIRFGIERLAPERRRTRLDQWLREELPERFEGRIVPVDGQVADTCGRLLAPSSAGRPRARRNGRFDRRHLPGGRPRAGDSNSRRLRRFGCRAFQSLAETTLAPPRGDWPHRQRRAALADLLPSELALSLERRACHRIAVAGCDADIRHSVR